MTDLNFTESLTPHQIVSNALKASYITTTFAVLYATKTIARIHDAGWLAYHAS